MDKTVTACCKINLGLSVVARRPDGYHDLETVFYPVPLLDRVRLRSAPADTVELSGHPLEGDPADNLVLRAARLLRQEGLPVPPLRVGLEKRVPSGAGLGGGSSDAAAVVRALNEELSLGLSPGRMESLLARLGADCPFFVRSVPVFAQGIGDVFSPVALSLRGWHLALVLPPDRVSTREAYARVRPRRPGVPVRDIVARPVREWRGALANDFEQSVFPLHPAVAEVKERLYREGAAYASMSGSGSCVYGLFEGPTHLEGRFPGCFLFECRL